MTLVLSNVASTSLSMAIGAATPSSAVANVVGSMAVMAQTLFGGFLLSKADIAADNLFTRGLFKLSYVNYAFEVGLFPPVCVRLLGC